MNFEERTSGEIPEVMNMPALMPMVPIKDLERVLYKYRMNPEKRTMQTSPADSLHFETK